MAFPLPDLEFEPTRGFWEAAQRESLEIPRCRACSAWSWYPPEACRACGADALDWVAVSGRGTLFSWCHVTRALFKAYAEKAPYVTGLVALEEDARVRLVTLLVDCDPDALRIDIAGAQEEWAAAEAAEAKGELEEALDHFISSQQFYATWRDAAAQIDRLKKAIAAKAEAGEGEGGQ